MVASGTSRYRARLVIGFTLVIGLLAAAWAWSLYAPVDAAVREQQQARLTDLARAAAVVVSASDTSLDTAVSRLAGDGEIRITVVAADGIVLADSQEATATLENHRDRPEIRSALSGRIGTDTRRSETQGVERLYVAVPARTATGEKLAIRTSQSSARLAAMSAEARRTGLLALAVVLMLAAFATWRLTRAAARPVERLAEAARAMAGGDLTSAVPTESDTLAPLSDALTSLRTQLRERVLALEAGQQTLRTALDGLSDGVLLLDTDRVGLVNRALGGMFRLPHGEIVGRRLAELGLPAPIESAITGAVAEDSPTTIDLGPDPFQHYHRLTVVPLGAAEGARRTLVAISDVTDRMRLDAVRRDFVANASHELKTPVASIVLLAESAANASADGDTATATAFVQQIEGEAARLRRLVAELLDLSRLESVPGAGEIADVRRAVDLALAGHRRSAALKGLTLAADLSAIEGHDVVAEVGVTDLAVALDNILSNAVAYTETGSVTIRVLTDADGVIIEVEDTGIGIPSSEVERVFERFYRVDRARSRTSGGTGLGLALVRNIAERAGGSATIASTPGEGTTVTLRLKQAR